MIRVPEWWSGDVSRETLEKLTAYAELVRKWTPKINLIAKSTIDDFETRHIWDSAQVFVSRPGAWADLGSGGGLPGIVIAILRQSMGTDTRVTLVESDQRKSTFLRTCGRELDLDLSVIAHRVETIDPLQADTISARALAPLDQLLGLASPHLAANGVCLFQKGAQWRDEITAAEENWRFSWTAKPSKTNAEAVVLELKDITRV